MWRKNNNNNKYEGTATKPLQSDMTVSYFSLFPIRLSWEFKQFNSSLVRF